MSVPIPTPEQLYSYEVHDSSDKQVGGKIEIVWVDEASSQPEFVGVNTNWLLKGKVHPIPLTEAEFSNGVIRVPYSMDQIKGSPDVGTDVELTAGLESELYGYYGLERPAGVGPTSRPTGSGLDDDSIVIPGTFNPITGDAQTLAETDDLGTSETVTAERDVVDTTGVEGVDTGRLRRVVREDEE